MLSSGVRPEQSFYDSVRKQETEKTQGTIFYRTVASHGGLSVFSFMERRRWDGKRKR